MTKTANYEFNKWELSDPVKMKDFNDNFTKVDTALKQTADAAPKIAFGTYDGTGDASSYSGTTMQTITLGFRPKAVFVSRSDGLYPTDGGAFFTRDSAITFQESSVMGTITETGFQVGTIRYSGSTLRPDLNTLNCTYHYLAIG